MEIKPAKHLHESKHLQTIKVLTHQSVFTPCVKSLLGSFGTATARKASVKVKAQQSEKG